MSWIVSLLIGVVVVLVITALTGYFVAQEFAYMAVDRSRLNARAAAGDAAAKRALKVTNRTSFMLSGAQLGITITGLLVGFVAEPLIGEAIGEATGDLLPAGAGIAIGTVIALVFSTIVQMLFGELFPKNLAIARPEGVALWLARSTNIYLACFGWLIAVFDRASNLLLRAVRIEPVHDVEHAASRLDLEHIVADSQVTGTLPADLSVLLDRIIDFPEHDAEHAMIPAPHVDTVPGTTSVATVRELMSTGHTRYPILDEQGDVTGVVQLLDVLGTPPEAQDRPVTEIMRPAVFLAATTALPDALARLREKGAELACVVDEYGGFAGVLTLEDLAEELVGELRDEHDPDGELVPVQQPDGDWNIPGTLHLDEAERVLGYDLPRGDYETLAGLAIAEIGDLPTTGQEVEVALPLDPADLAEPGDPVERVMTLRVLEVDRHVPALVRVHIETRDEDDEDTDGAENARDEAEPYPVAAPTEERA